MYVVTCSYNFEGDLTYYDGSNLIARTIKLSEAKIFDSHEDACGAALKRPHEDNAQVMPVGRKELFKAILQGT